LASTQMLAWPTSRRSSTWHQPPMSRLPFGRLEFQATKPTPSHLDFGSDGGDPTARRKTAELGQCAGMSLDSRLQ